MALQLNNFTGFESRGPEEAESTQGSITFPTGSPRSGIAELSVPAASNTFFRLPWVVGTDAGADYIFGIGIDFASLTDDTSGVVHVRDSAGTVILNVRVGASSKIVIRDNVGTDVITATNAISTGSYVYIEVYFQHIGTNANGELFIDGVSEGTTTTADFSAGNNLDSTATLSIKSDTSNAFTAEDVYILSGASSAADRLGDAEVFGYQTSDTGTTNLLNGSWDETGDTPGVEEADGTAVEVAGASSTTAVSDLDDGTNARGREGGPTAGAADVSGTIKGAKYVFNLKRINGSGTSLRYLFGNADDGETSSANISTILTTTYAIFEELSEAAGVVPTASENFSFGLSAGTDDVGNRTIFAADIWAMLLHVPAGEEDNSDLEWAATQILGQQEPVREPNEVVEY